VYKGLSDIQVWAYIGLYAHTRVGLYTGALHIRVYDYILY